MLMHNYPSRTARKPLERIQLVNPQRSELSPIRSRLSAFSGFISAKTSRPLRTKICDKLRPRKFVSNSGSLLMIDVSRL
jgi:hypothetical protein